MVFISQRNELRGFQEEKFRGVKIDLHGGGKKSNGQDKVGDFVNSECRFVGH